MFGLTKEEETAILTGPKGASTALMILKYVVSTKSKGATCHECAEAVGFPYQSGSVRYHELVKVGCLIPTKQRRPTRTGGLAAVHRAAPKPDFKKYLAFLQTARGQRKPKPGLNAVEQQVLAAGMEFLKKWKQAKTKKSQVEASVQLVNAISKIRP